MSDLKEWMNPLVPADTRVRIADGEIERLRAELAAGREREARMHKTIDTLLAHCPDGECVVCAQAVCPHGEPLHFHHDGCPACEQDAALAEGAQG